MILTTICLLCFEEKRGNFIVTKSVCFSGIGYALDPNFSFAKVAAPYAQVCTLSMFWKLFVLYWLCIKLLTDIFSNRSTCNVTIYICIFNVLEIQELLDIKQTQRSGAELVQEIRRQANDVLTTFYLVSSV